MNTNLPDDVRVRAQHVTLVYVSESGEQFHQPATDLIYSGSLIDPETGDDMDIDHVLIAGEAVRSALNPSTDRS